MDMTCIQNAATGREATMPHVIVKSAASKRGGLVGRRRAGRS